MVYELLYGIREIVTIKMSSGCSAMGKQDDLAIDISCQGHPTTVFSHIL